MRLAAVLIATLCLPAVADAQADLDRSTIQERITRGKRRLWTNNDLPVVEGQAAVAHLTGTGRERARFFDGNGETLASRAASGSRSMITHVDSIRGLPLALPVAESDLIVRGTVTSARGQLSADGSNVYSEFDVRLGRTLKAPAGMVRDPGSTITVLRQGGVVRFPTGVMTIRREDLGMPLVGSEYILFLDSYSRLDEAFMIVTGYCLDRGRVTPLDINPQSVAWDDRSAAELLAALAE